MSSANVDLQELADEERTPAEQILANALELYAAIPPGARVATLRALRATAPTAHPSLAQEVSKAIIGFQLRQRRAAALRRFERRVAAPAGAEGEGARVVGAGPAPLSMAEDDALGAEAVRGVKASRERRAGVRHGP